MADYTIKNFDDVDDSAPEGVDGLEARFARKQIGRASCRERV